MENRETPFQQCWLKKKSRSGWTVSSCSTMMVSRLSVHQTTNSYTIDLISHFAFSRCIFRLKMWKRRRAASIYSTRTRMRTCHWVWEGWSPEHRATNHTSHTLPHCQCYWAVMYLFSVIASSGCLCWVSHQLVLLSSTSSQIPVHYFF